MNITTTSNNHQRAERADEYQNKDSVRLDGKDVLELSVLQPWRSLVQIAFEWLSIALVIAICDRFWSIPLYIATVVWIGARQHALSILMYDGAHIRILPNRKQNDPLTEILTAWPLFITMKAYRRTHFAHHQYANTEKDPDWIMKVKYNEEDWQFPTSKLNLFWLLAKDLFGLNAPMIVKFCLFYSINPISKTGKERSADIRYILYRIVFYATVFAILSIFGLLQEFVLYWIVPFFTWLALVLHVRSIAEHFGLENENQLNRTRTTYPSFWEKWLVAPNNTNYHLDHHLYPSIPFYNLPKAHVLLLKQNAFSQHAHLSNTYIGALLECTNNRA